MSETLRDLVVSLSLNSDNFTRNIKSINKQIQEAESAFHLASAGVENFETTTVGLSAKLSTLQRTFQLQQDAVGQYERALQQASDKLQECYARQNDYAQRLVDAKDKQQQLKTEVASAAQAYRHYKNTLGETDSATIAAKANLDAYKDEYRVAVQEVKKLEGQNVALKKSTQNAADAFSAAQSKLNGAKGAVKETAAEIDRCNRQLALSQTSWKSAGEAMQVSQRSIASIGKQLKTAESSYRLAAAGVKDFDKSTAGLTAKLTLLQEKLGLQQKAVAEYEKVLAAAKEQLQAAQQVNDPDRIRQATDAVQDAETALNNARAAVKQTRADIANCNKELKTAQSEWTKAGKSMESFGKACDTAGKNLIKAGKLLSTTLTTPIAALGTAAVKASIDFESSFTSVRKTVDATEAQFEQLAATSKKMSTEVAAGTDEINEVMAAGGQLGVATEHLSDFTRVMIDLGNSCEDLNANDAATTIAQFANIMGTSQDQFSNIGSTLVDLGNNFATTEKPIMEMAHRMAGAGKQVGLTEAQVLGFAAALSSVGIEAQMGGSAFSKALIKMEVASATGGDALEDFGRVAGMTAEQFKKLWDSDPAAAFEAFIVGLSKLDEEGESAIAVLDEIGVKEIRLRDTMLRAVNATDLFSRAQSMATSAWKKNTALSEEANKRYATTESRLKNLKNTALLFGQQIGDDLNPTIRSLIDGAEELLQKFLSMDEAQRRQIIQFAAYAAAVGPVLLVLGKITKGVGSVSTAFGKFATSVGKAGGGWKGFLTVLGKSPAVWFAVAAAVVAGTVALADYVSGAKQAREALKGMQETADKWKNTAAETFYGNSAGLSFFGMSKSDFVRDRQSAQKWVDGLLAVWSDGEKESNEIVSHWTDSFKTLTDSTRTELQNLKDTADKIGYSLPGGRNCDADPKAAARKGAENGVKDWFIWNGVKCTEYGVHVLEQPPMTIPAERATFTNIPGRSGSLTTLEGDAVYDDLLLTAQCLLSDPAKIPAAAAWLRGGGKVTFANRPGGFYHARIVNQIPFEKILRGNPHRSFSVNFRCKPFWYQENVPAITVVESGAFITNPGTVASEPVVTVYGSGTITLMIGMTLVELENIDGSITLDTPLQEAYKGLDSLNSAMNGDFPLLQAGTNAVSWTGNVSRVEIRPNWRFLV